MACKQTQDQAGIKATPKPWTSLDSDQEFGQAVEEDRLFLKGWGKQRSEYPDYPLTHQPRQEASVCGVAKALESISFCGFVLTTQHFLCTGPISLFISGIFF